MSTVQVDAINESTTNAGVTVDGVLIKDGQVDGVDVSTLSVDTDTMVQFLLVIQMQVQLQILHLIMYLLQLIKITK